MAMPRMIKKIPGYDRIRDTIWYFLKYQKKGYNIQNLDKVYFGSEEKYPDKTFYIIRMTPLYPMMLFSFFHHILGHIIFAIENGYIPVIDQKNYHTAWNDDHPVNGTSNAWEYYFKQPTEYTLDDAYHAKNTLLSSMNNYMNATGSSFTDTDKISARWLYISKYMQIRPDILALADKQYELLFTGHSNIMGVMHRRAYKSLLGKNAENHPVLPEDDIFLEKTRELFTEWNMDYVCLSSNDRLVVDMFRDVFGGKLLVTNRARFNDPENIFDPVQKPYLSTLEYLVDVILLSRCDTFVGTMSGGTLGVLDFNHNQFKDKYIYPFEIFHGDESNSRVFGTLPAEVEVSERFYDALKKVH